MARAYIVEGTTGEHSDHRTWPVAVFTSRSRAVTFMVKANQWLKDNGLHDEFYSTYSHSHRQRVAKTSPFDPNLDVDYTNSSYSIVPTRLNPELPR